MEVSSFNMRFQLRWFKHQTLNLGIAGSSPARRTMGWTAKAQVHKTSKRREYRRAQTGTRFLEFKVTATLKQFIGFKQGNAASPEYSTYMSPQLNGREQWISNPLVRGSSPFGDTIYGFSLMERVAAYEAVDRGSNPLIRTILTDSRGVRFSIS